MQPNAVADPPGVPPNPTPHPVLQAASWLLDFVFHRFLFGWGLLLLAVAAGVLTSAWTELSGQERSLLGRMTRRGTVAVLDAAVEIHPQSGPDTVMDPDRAFWHHDYRLEYLLELSHVPSHPVRRYRSQPLQAFVDHPFWPTLASEPLFRTPRVTVKIDKGLHGLLAKTPARAGVAFSVLDPPPNASREERSYWGSQFDQFWVSFDMPMHALAIEWLSASGAPQIPVRYDPRNPGDFLFEEAFAAASAGGSRPLSIALGIVLGGFGLFVLVFAVSLLTAGTTTVWVPRVLFCAILVSIPFASPYLQSAAAYLGLPPLPRSFLEEWTRSTDPRGRAGFLEELSASQQSALVALPVDVAHSRYKDVFAFFQVSNGGRRFGSFDEAMGAISAQIAAQLAVMPAADLIRFFKLLDNHMAQREDGWDGPFLEGVRNLALDTTRSASLRSWAISAFCDVSSPRKDAALADFIYRQYVSSEPDVRGYWRSFFLDYARAPSFAEDLRSDDRARVRRALELWARHDDLPGEVRFLIPRLKQLATHPDPAIRELALKKWRSRTDWQG